MNDISTEEVCTLLATLTISMLITVSDQIPPKSALATRIRKCEEAIKSLAGLHACQLDERVIEAGVKGWGAAMDKIQEELEK